MENVVSLVNVNKDYILGKTTVQALKNIHLNVAEGDFISIAGPSGSGKTTLLNLIGCVDVATSGQVLINGQDTHDLSERRLTDLRLHTIGFIFQSFNLVSVLSVFQNVEFPLLLQNRLGVEERKHRVMELLKKVGIENYAKHRPNELSGGQRQRVAIARALVTRPRIVLADEPTANLDSKTGETIIDLMKEMNEEEKTTFIFSTHDARVMAHAHTIVNIADGEIISKPSGPSKKSVPKAAVKIAAEKTASKVSKSAASSKKTTVSKPAGKLKTPAETSTKKSPARKTK